MDKTESAAGKGTRIDAVALLTADHKLVQQLFKEFELLHRKGDVNEQKAEIVNHICNELMIHAQVEEEIFYPAVQQLINDQDLMDEAAVEHEDCRDAIRQLRAMLPGDQYYDAKVTVLSEDVNRHIREEQDKMFPKVRKMDLDLRVLAVNILRRKEELQVETGALSIG